MAVPAYSLQILLENAIKHGISPKPEGGTVQITAKTKEDRFRLEVRDDGLGANIDNVDGSTDHGLSLLRQQLQRLYGENGSLVLRTETGRGFTATLDMPAKQESSGNNSVCNG